MTNEITIIIADDHPIVRKGLREVIEEDKRLRVVWEANNGQEAVAAIERFSPNVTILDVDMPVMNGFEAAREIKAKKLQTEIIFLTMHRDEDLFNAAIDLGAKGFVLKDSALSDIVECIKTVAESEHYASHALTIFLINRSRRAIQLSEEQPSINDLTPTERRVLKLIAENLTTKEIGEELFISPRTVEKHRQNICQKLNLQGSHSLLKFALQHKSQLL
ncbi:MAG TPA: response regulator transcription factor [Pyrinomonadaceae bacterium]|nr:response regulator transcription factor [Pyrinomonadaceae bacterium]